MKMTLSRALRYKKRILESIQKLTLDIQQGNSLPDGEEREIDVRKSWKNRQLYVAHLTELKLALQKASFPIQRQIFELAETKGEVVLLQGLDVRHGIVPARYREDQSLTFVAQIRKAERDKMIQDLQNKIDSLQIEIDSHNNGTFIEINEMLSAD